MMGRVEGKVALVTGGGSGMGRASSTLFAREGARGVVVLDVRPEGGNETVEQIKAAGGDAIFVQADVRNEDEIERAVQMAVERYGRLDILHNHTGVAHYSPIIDITVDRIDEMLAVNCRGFFLVAKHAARQMVKQQGGSMVNTGSDLAFIGLGGLAVYSATKTAVVGATRALAVELAPHNIRVNCVCPGFTYTGQTAEIRHDAAYMEEMLKDYLIKELGEPIDIAMAVLYFASDESRFTTGAALVVDGGHSIK
jgi:NAD(P)-dependent dehydrogenase (short-subunit alcohol dehydrogenase family)